MYIPDVAPAFVSLDKLNNVYVPLEMIEYAEKYLHCSKEVNDNKDYPENEYLRSYKLIPVSNGEEYALDKKNFVQVYDCFHTVPTVGYGFFEKRQKLKQEYKGLPGKEIARLRETGTNIYDIGIQRNFVFLGDTTSEVFHKHDVLFEYPVIIVECTFLYPDHEENAKSSGHIHWSHIEEIIINHPDNIFVLIHFSMRYKISEIIEFFKDKPQNVYPWISDIK